MFVYENVSNFELIKINKIQKKKKKKCLICNHQHHTTREIEEVSAMDEELKALRVANKTG